MGYTNVSNIELLSRLVGPRAAKRMYRGSLAPLFIDGESRDAQHHETLAVAREVVWRWLGEELSR